MSEGIQNLIELIARLRGDGGCPWDKKQTFESLAPYLLEETGEAIAEIEKKSPAGLCEELGDVLLIIVMLSRMAEEQGSFDFNDVVRGICEKIVRRHPHVFAGVKLDTPEEVLDNWKKIKLAEKKAAGDIQ